MALSEDAQSMKPSSRSSETFTAADDDELAASLSRRLSASSDSTASSSEQDSVPVDRDASLSGASRPFWKE